MPPQRNKCRYSNGVTFAYYYITLRGKKFQLIFFTKKNMVAIPGMIYFDTGSSSSLIPTQDDIHSMTSQIAQSIFVDGMGVSTKYTPIKVDETTDEQSNALHTKT